MFGVEGVHVLDSRIDDGGLVVDVETDQTLAGCPDCGVVRIGHGRRVHRLHDIPALGRPVRLRWFKRVWRCPEQSCPRMTFSESHDLAMPHAKLTNRAVGWAVDGLRHDDTTVSALARHLGVDWHTAWNAIEAERRFRPPPARSGPVAAAHGPTVDRPPRPHHRRR